MSAVLQTQAEILFWFYPLKKIWNRAVSRLLLLPRCSIVFTCTVFGPHFVHLVVSQSLKILLFYSFIYFHTSRFLLPTGLFLLFICVVFFYDHELSWCFDPHIRFCLSTILGFSPNEAHTECLHWFAVPFTSEWKLLKRSELVMSDMSWCHGEDPQ